VSTQLYDPLRCALCGKKPDHALHEASAPPPLWRRLLRLWWPSWMWGEPEGTHLFVSRASRVEMSDKMAALRRRVVKQQRAKERTS
jgi:hypothetical protein